MNRTDRVVVVSGQPLAFVVAKLNGSPLTGRMANPDNERDASLLQATAVIDKRIPAEILSGYDEELKAWKAKLRYDSPLLAPKALNVTRGEDGVRHELLFNISTYSGFKAAGTLFRALTPEQRVDLMKRSSLGTPPIVSHAIGANFNLVTADGYLLTTVRSHSAGTEAGKIATAMSEAVTVKDLEATHGGVWNPLTSALRGFKEELGLDEHELTELRVNAIVAQVADGGLSISGSATTTLTKDQVLERHPMAIDASEAQRLIFTPITEEAVRELLVDPSAEVRAALKNPDEVWAAWGPTGVLETVEPYLGPDVTTRLAAELAGPQRNLGLDNT